MSAEKNPLYLIRTFNQLVKYLKDELNWPIETDDFEELTFDYAPEELGLDAETAVKIKEIKQLRPLTNKQPWGIFFVNFAPKQLPVVALRRILSTLVIKKRQSANKSQQAAWRLHDLLFISSYGETDHRDITFAHFAEEQGMGDLPTLRLLGWDDEDTKLKLDFVERELKAKLRWPDDESDISTWRTNWSSAFRLRPREVIKTSQQLAIRLADLARGIRKRASNVLAVESDKGPLRKMHAAFKEALIHDLTIDDFADMYAQTISYGLLTARISRPARIVADNLSEMVPVTNPFLKDLLETFLTIGGRKGKIDFDELGINDVVLLLRDADMEAVLLDFGKRNPEEDPVIHFYELFLKEYDAKKRMQRGVFYTPRQVVSYIVRCAHDLLKRDFGLDDGLASTITWGEMATRNPNLRIPDGAKLTDPFVNILDPATGTATFLVEVIDLIFRTMTGKWERQRLSTSQQNAAWNEYVPKHLLPRLHGYELLMAPFAIAHMKIGLKLHETHYRFGSNQRARVYLTNALEPASDEKKQREFEEWVPALAHEARAVNKIKRSSRFTVVLGNPPYSKLSANLSDYSRSLVESYKFIAGQRIKEKGALQFEMNLQDDYIKFLRLSEQTIGGSGIGVVGLITNSGYLGNPTLRGVRWSIGQTYARIDILDLHGHQASSMQNDENVFDILQGVAISLLCRIPGHRGFGEVRYSSLSGQRETKYKALASSIWDDKRAELLAPEPPLYRFTPEDVTLRSEFNRMAALPELFPRNSAGFISSRDGLVIDRSRDILAERITAFGSDRRAEEKIYESFGFQESKRLNVRTAQAAVRRDDAPDKNIIPCLYRPFDTRWVYYKRELIESFKPIEREMNSGKNLALVATRQVTRNQFEHAFVTRNMIEIKACSHDRNTQIFPLFICGNEGGFAFASEATPNLNQALMNTFAKDMGLKWMSGNSEFGKDDELTAQRAFCYFYALLYCPSYRLRYFEFLRSDFPRLPFTSNQALFRALAGFGRELIALHLLESSKLTDSGNAYIGTKNPEVGKTTYTEKTVWLDKDQTCGFSGVPEVVWKFHIGGYQVCEKWLKDRKGDALSKNDIAHYNKIVVALSETIRLMKKIDEVIDEHGGWPGAFATTKE